MIKIHRRLQLGTMATVATAFTLAATMLLPTCAWAADSIGVGGDWYDSAFTLDGISWDGADTITLADYHGTSLQIGGSVTIVLEGENTLDLEIATEELHSAIESHASDQGDPADVVITGGGSLAISVHTATEVDPRVAFGISTNGGSLTIAGTTVRIDARSEVRDGGSLAIQAENGASIYIIEGSTVMLAASAESFEPEGAIANGIQLDGGGRLVIEDSSVEINGRTTGTTTIEEDGHPAYIAFACGISAYGGSSLEFANSRLDVSGSFDGIAVEPGSLSITNCDLNARGGVSMGASCLNGELVVIDCEGSGQGQMEEDDNVRSYLGSMMNWGEAILQHTGPASAYAAGVQDDSAPAASASDQAMADNAEQLPIVIGLAGGFFALILIAGIIVKSRRKRVDK